MSQEKINLDGISDEEKQILLLSYENLCNKGSVKVITDENEIQNLVDRFSEAGIDLYDGVTLFQNVFFVDESYYLVQVKKTENRVQVNAKTVYTLGASFGLTAFKALKCDYGKIVLLPRVDEYPRILKFLSRWFHSDEVNLDGNDIFSKEYSLTATNKETAMQLFFDVDINAIVSRSDTQLVVVKDAVIVWLNEANEKATITINNIIASFKGK